MSSVRSLAFLPLFFVAGLAARYPFAHRTETTPPEEANAPIEERSTAASSPLPDAVSTDVKAQRLVVAALRKSAALERDSELYLAIQAFTVEDLKKLLLDPEALKTLAAKLKEANWDAIRNVYAGLITHWLAIDSTSVATWAPRLLDLLPKKENARGYVLDALAAKRPEEMLAAVASQKEAGGRAEIISRALRVLASRSLTKAQAWLKDCTDPADRLVAEKALRLGIVEAEPLRAMELSGAVDSREEGLAILEAATEQAKKIGRGMLRQLATIPMKAWMIPTILTEFSELDPELAVDLAIKGLSERDSSVQADPRTQGASLRLSFSSLTRKDPLLAISKLDGIEGPQQRAAAVSAIGSEWAARDPAAALAWLGEKSAAERTSSQNWGYGTNDALLMAVGAWVASDRTNAQAWANALPKGELYDKVQGQLARVLASRGDAAAATQILFASGRAVDPRALSDIARSWARDDPQAAAAWAIAQPAGALQSRTLASVVGTWAADNPSAAQAWLAQFPAGESRDRSISAFLSRPGAWTNDAKAQIEEFDAWFDLIDDPWQRARVATRNFSARKQTDPEGARRWLMSLPNVDAGLIRRTLSRAN
jgi:hypothetical protein